MSKRHMLCKVYQTLNKKIKDQFGFTVKDVTYTKVVNYFNAPKDASSLAVTRILFGICMLFDIPDERGGAIMDRRWDDKICHFPLFPFIRAVPMPYMTLAYVGLSIGVLGITLGLKFRVTSALFTVCYWYLLLIEKSYWNNHSYLFGLLAFLLSFTDANCLWSLDAYLNPTHSKATVPYWNYFILKYQLFILYFMAGMKKGTAEWLTGYSMQGLSQHWVFMPFRLFLTCPQIDYLIVHCFIFLFDLTIAVWMMWARTRHVAMVFCALFHLMNSRLFWIGMFPWVCLATQPLFYPFDWPKQIITFSKEKIIKLRIFVLLPINDVIYDEDGEYKDSDNVSETDTKNDDFDHKNERNECKTIDDQFKTNNQQEYDTDFEFDENDENGSAQGFVAIGDNKDPTDKDFDENEKVNCRSNLTACLIFAYVILQVFLPYSHFLTKGYNNWTNGLYGYSWDMMVHNWDSHSVVVKIVDNDNQKDFYLDPYIYTPNDRWTRHGDMIHQYSHCLKNKLTKDKPNQISNNISIFFDIWYSVNGRFSQRMFNSKVDMLKAKWSPFEEVSYLVPLLDEAVEWRSVMDKIRTEVYGWSNRSGVVFLADYPGYDLKKFIPQEMTNVTLTLLQGFLVFETEVTSLQTGLSYPLTSGNRIKVDSGVFHRVINIGKKPAYYMYTFINNTTTETRRPKPTLPILQELRIRLSNMFNFVNLIINRVYGICFWKTQCD